MSLWVEAGSEMAAWDLANRALVEEMGQLGLNQPGAFGAWVASGGRMPRRCIPGARYRRSMESDAARARRYEQALQMIWNLRQEWRDSPS